MRVQIVAFSTELLWKCFNLYGESKGKMRLLLWLRIGCAVLAAGLLGGVCRAASWYPLGPYGGDARAFAVDPADSKHLFLGTATGWIYDSHDGGTSWTRVAQIANRNDLVIDNIVVDHKDPKRLVVGAFTADHLGDGGLFISNDYGKNWYSQAEMRGQSVRALARSASNQDELVVGTLKGVFRSMDNGVHWQQISPEGSTEIHEIESVAIDPSDPNVIYAGTWHLPWKTTDGGATWHNIKEGIIDDSDVFSIIVDPKKPNIVYASACSGIYKSSNGGDMFRRVEGIPSAARRTRKLEQDPGHPETVYAGTTEGLYRTLDSGAQWDRITPGNVIVNDVYVDPTNSNHVLIATDRGGVFRSEDGGSTFETSNTGFSARQVIAFASDAQHPDTLYVGVVNDKTTGGVFQSTDGAVHWQQQSDGLGGRDVFSLISLSNGTLLAGTGHGIFRLADGNWADSSVLEAASPVEKAAVSSAPIARPSVVRVSASSRQQPGKSVHGSSQSQVHRAHNPGKPAPSSRKAQATAVRRKGHTVAVKSPSRRITAAGSARFLRVSAVRSQHPALPVQKPHTAVKAAAPKAAKSGRIDAEVYDLVRSGDTLFAASGTGLLRSGDDGQHWAMLSSLPLTDVHFVAVQPSATDLPKAIAMKTTADAGSTPNASATAEEKSAPAVPDASAAIQAADGAAPTLLVGTLNGMMLSDDGGMTWNNVALPKDLTQVGAVCIDSDKTLWVGGREGVWFSADRGATWKTLRNLFVREVDSIYFDARGHRVLVTSSSSPNAFSVQLPNEKVTYWDTGWKLRFVRPVGGHLIGATLYDGIVVQPEMVDSPLSASAAAK